MKTAIKMAAGVIALYALAALLAYGVAKADCVGVSTLGVKKNGTMFSTFLNFPESYGYRFCFMYWEDAQTVCLSMTDQLITWQRTGYGYPGGRQLHRQARVCR